ncbi:vWA domain-containing protein [Cesiribacter andamanensis]|uniref:Aerotolerance regulator N-terminal domain-containing protein n=1 Tax=Cesiribacter andamanensis AMV16 TaxID=1279009 RepID=M7N7J5_9BACT|nr:BatA and WFA domain-containing protein [Cesiribacter andamanensis]EMR04578.1 hypothetical protein ADICEAN_00336 [Cesiribacter andamanensis AMV16]
MNLLAPGFLYALAALAIPIIIHLFQFRRVRRVFFSNTRFLEQVKQMSQKKRQLKHLLVLLCRLAFLFFLVLTFARPYIPGPHQADARRVDIYLDNSYSMTNEVEEGVSAFDVAITYANAILGAYPQGTRFRLVTNGFEAGEQYYYTPEVIRDKLTELQLSGRGRTLEEIIDRLQILPAEDRSEQREIFLLSDMQRNSWSADISPIASDSTNRYFLVPLAYQQHKNLYIDSVYLEKPYYLPGTNNTLVARVVNTGSATEEVPLKLAINDRQMASTTISVPAKGKQEVKFPLNFSIDRLSQARLELVDYPVNFDNEFYFALRKGDPVHVLELTEQAGTGPVNRVFSDTTLFRIRSREASNFTFSELGWADLVVVNALQQAGSALASALQQYVEEGGSLLYIPHAQAQESVIAGIASRLAVQTTQAENSIRLAAPDMNNPFFEGVFEESSTRFTMPQARPVVSWAGRADNVLSLQTGGPFVGQSGKVWLVASPLQDAYTNFHRHALFVPVMYKIAFGSKNISNPLYYPTTQSIFEVQVAEQAPETVFRMRREGEEIIPAQRLANRQLMLDVPAYSLNPGFYQLQADDSLVQLLAFNHDPAESIPEQLQPEELEEGAAAFSHIQLLNDAARNAETAELNANFGAVMLWKWTLLLALLFLLCEVLLIRFWK